MVSGMAERSFASVLIETDTDIPRGESQARVGGNAPGVKGPATLPGGISFEAPRRRSAT